MHRKKFLPLLYVVSFALVAFGLHSAIFYLFGLREIADGFYHPLINVYGFFVLCSIMILTILIVVREKSIDNVGQIFLLLTCSKMGIAFAMLYPVLEAARPNMAFERMNFFLIFALFLTVETIVTIRVLNKN